MAPVTLISASHSAFLCHRTVSWQGSVSSGLPGYGRANARRKPPKVSESVGELAHKMSQFDPNASSTAASLHVQ